MKSYEEWSKLYHEHNDKAREHLEKSHDALHRFIETHDWAYWDVYIAENKLHNKHWGIAQAMYTRRYGRL